jgi:hypothetical protein
MKKIALIALAASAAIATPAAAQSVTGTIILNGSVAPKCLVVPGNGNTFGTTIQLGELSDASGKLRASSTLETQVNGVTGTTARVVCTGSAPTISVDATAITAATATATTGYDDSIDFNAHVVVTTTTGTPAFDNDSANAALAATAIGGRVANNGSDNIVITTSNFRTNNPTTDLLVADLNYSGRIVVVIGPGA